MVMVSSGTQGVPSKNVASKGRVLIVDDNKDIRMSLEMGLRLLGYDVRTAEDGLTGLEQVARFRPDTVMIDLALPLINGWELARRLRRLTMLHRQPRLIAITGMGAPAHRARSVASGFDHHLLKPFTLREIDQLLCAQ
jgi:DNA-binding response OmpR family regulator